MADRKGPGNAAASSGDPPSTTGPATSIPPPTMSTVRSTSPYGTRSRNRGARVNYAEDKDNDMDYEFATPFSQPSNGTNEPSSATAGPRKQSTTAGTAKDPKDCNSTALAVPASASAGKKRKGMGAGGGGGAGSVGGGGGNGGGSGAMTPTMAKDASYSNMLSFEKPYLKDGKLKALDGTELSVHGT